MIASLALIASSILGSMDAGVRPSPPPQVEPWAPSIGSVVDDVSAMLVVGAEAYDPHGRPIGPIVDRGAESVVVWDGSRRIVVPSAVFRLDASGRLTMPASSAGFSDPD